MNEYINDINELVMSVSSVRNNFVCLLEATMRMSRKFETRKFITIFFLTTIFLASNGYCWSGKVIDKDSKAPIEGAIIVRMWERDYVTPAGSVSSLVAVEEKFSDENGNFFVSNYKRFFHIDVPFFAEVNEKASIIYKSGYYPLSIYDKSKSIELEKIPNNYFLRREANERVSFLAEDECVKLNILMKEDGNDLKKSETRVPGVFFYGFYYDELHLCAPKDIDVDKFGRVIAADTCNKFVPCGRHFCDRGMLLLNPDGEYVRDINAYYHFGADYVEFDNKNNIYALEGSKIYKLFGDKSYSCYDIDFKINQNIYEEKLFHISKNNTIALSHYDKNSEKKVISLYDHEGDMKCEIKIPDSNDGEHKTIVDITSDSSGNFYALSTTYKSHLPGNHENYCYIDEINEDCKVISTKKISVDLPPTSILIGDNEFIISSQYSLYFYDKNGKQIFQERFKPLFRLGDDELKRNEHLGSVSITKMAADENWNYIYLLDSRYDRILKYDLQKRTWATRSDGGNFRNLQDYRELHTEKVYGCAPNAPEGPPPPRVPYSTGSPPVILNIEPPSR